MISVYNALLEVALSEEDLPLRSDLEQLAQSPNCDASLYQYEVGRFKCVHLSNIRVRKDAPRGTGTKFMVNLLSLADKHGRYVTLEVGAHEPADRRSDFKQTTSQSRLRAFYSRLGFRKNSARGLYQLRGSMHYSPK